MNEVGREVDGIYYEETPVLECLSTKGFQKKMGGWDLFLLIGCLFYLSLFWA